MECKRNWLQLFPPEACTDSSCPPVRVHGWRRASIQLWEGQGSEHFTWYCSAREKGRPPLTLVLFQLVSLSKESSSPHSLRTPFPTNEQSRIGSLIGQRHGSFPSSCPSRAGRSRSPRSSLRGQVWALAATEIPAQRALGALEWSSPTAQGNTPATTHQAAGCLAAKLPVFVPQCHKPHCVWGCLLGELSKETPRANTEEELPGWILTGNKFGVRLLSLKPAPVHMHRKGPAGGLQNL